MTLVKLDVLSINRDKNTDRVKKVLTIIELEIQLICLVMSRDRLHGNQILISSTRILSSSRLDSVSLSSS